MSMYCLHPLSCNIHGDQKKVLNPLELEIVQLLASVWMLETEPGSSAKAFSALKF